MDHMTRPLSASGNAQVADLTVTDKDDHLSLVVTGVASPSRQPRYHHILPSPLNLDDNGITLNVSLFQVLFYINDYRDAPGPRPRLQQPTTDSFRADYHLRRS